MAFAMRMQLNEEIIKKDSFKDMYINNKRNGFSFDVQLGYYRGHYLSDIDLLEVYIDGEKVDQEAVTFAYRNKELPVYKLKYAITEFWSQVEPATIHVIKKGGLAKGNHKIELKLMLRVPYMNIGPGHMYMPLDSGDVLDVRVEE
ncbi:hypothetical protein EDD63_12712 [Breznakia blatticola]|uniref:C-deglycosylation enzyme beta subunit n=1 Tax=Breznakia blatticola TaxID=1754012 RepID=A0A4R7ZGA4_9FIRM|nr:DUF6379 domain-containing protein [Breznakia blatticola]TDW16185.1 hypothetical protein EDD63_12712 [Breznakia blatticola]